jgi:hypothetical protein
MFAEIWICVKLFESVFECSRARTGADAGDTPIRGHGANGVKLSHCDEEALFPLVTGWFDVPHKDGVARRGVMLSAKVYIPTVLARSFVREMNHDWSFFNFPREQ